jgi:hypothetical protein
MDETLISALANIPFAVVLMYWIKLDFQQRRRNMVSMVEMVDKFTSTLKECCGREELTEVNQKVNHG